MEKVTSNKICKLTNLRKTLISEIMSYLNLYKDYAKMIKMNRKLREALLYNLFSFIRKDKHALNFYSKYITVLNTDLHTYFKTQILKKIHGGKISDILSKDSILIKIYVLEMENAFMGLVKNSIIEISQVPKVKKLIPLACGVLCNHLNNWLIKNSLISLEFVGIEIGFEGAFLLKKLIGKGRLEYIEIVDCKILQMDLHHILQGVIDYENYLTVDLTGTKLDEKAVSMCGLIERDIKKKIYFDSAGIKKNKKGSKKFNL